MSDRSPQPKGKQVNTNKQASKELLTWVLNKSDRARASLELERSNLGVAVSEGIRAESLVYRLNSIADGEGQSRVFDTVMAIVTNQIQYDNTTDETIVVAVTKHLVDRLTAGADDTWSGRANDVRRCEFEGTRTASAAVFEQITWLHTQKETSK